MTCTQDWTQEDFLNHYTMLYILELINEIEGKVFIIYDDSISQTFIKKIEREFSNIEIISRTKALTLSQDFEPKTFLFCLSLTSEKQLVDIFRKITTLENIYAVISDIIPLIMTATDLVDRYQPGTLKIESLNTHLKPSQSVLYYAILCCPRCGSNFLCELLRNNGVGLPKEHIKEQIIYLMKHRQEEGFDLRSFFNYVAVSAIQNGYFGTKVISHFLEDMLAVATEQEYEFLATWISSFKFIYMYRSDKVMQAVSLYRAQQTQLWHNDNSQYSNSRANANIEYNFQQIEDTYNFLLQQENYLLARVSQIKKQYKLAVLEVAYEDLVARPQEVVSDIAVMLGSTTPVRIEAQEKQIHGEREIYMANNFQFDYREFYSKEPIRNFYPVYD